MQAAIGCPSRFFPEEVISGFSGFQVGLDRISNWPGIRPYPALGLVWKLLYRMSFLDFHLGFQSFQVGIYS